MSKILNEIKGELVRKEVVIKDKIMVEEDTYEALVFFKEQGISVSDIVKEALGTWRRKGVVGLSNVVKKELAGDYKNDEK